MGHHQNKQMEKRIGNSIKQNMEQHGKKHGKKHVLWFPENEKNTETNMEKHMKQNHKNWFQRPEVELKRERTLFSGLPYLISLDNVACPNMDSLGSGLRLVELPISNLLFFNIFQCFSDPLVTLFCLIFVYFFGESSSSSASQELLWLPSSGAWASWHVQSSGAGGCGWCWWPRGGWLLCLSGGNKDRVGH